MSDGIEVVQPVDPEYKKVQNAVTKSKARRARVDYGDLKIKYNQAAISSIMVISTGTTMRLNNISSALGRRGLEHRVDFTVTRLFMDSNGNEFPEDRRPIVVTKLTDKTLK